MQYFYSEKFFARDLFDAAKAKLREPSPGAAVKPRHWLDAMNYGASFVFLSPSIKFRTKRGDPLRIASAPFCSRDPGLICRLPHISEHAAPGLQAGLDSHFGTSAQAVPGIGVATPSSPPSDSFGAAQGPPSSAMDRNSADIAQPAAPPSPNHGISTALLSTLLSLAVAITVGIIVGNSNTFKLQEGSSRRPNDMLADAGTASNDLHVSPRLTLDAMPPAPPRSSPADSRPARQVRKHRKAEIPESPNRQAVIRRAEIPQPHAGARPLRHSTARNNKPVTRSTPATSSQTAMARKAPARPATVAPTAPDTSAKLAASRPARQSETQPGTQYARCESLKGLLRRERCKWNVCGGKWGRQGCPAYQHNAMPGAGYGQLGQVGQTQPSAAGNGQDGS